MDAQCRSPLAQRLRVSLSGPHPGINEAPFSCAALPTSSIGQGGCPRCGCEGQTQSPESPYRANLGKSKYGGPCVSLPPPVAQGPVVRRQWDLAVSDWHYMNSLAWVVEPRPEIGPTESINAFFFPRGCCCSFRPRTSGLTLKVLRYQKTIRIDMFEVWFLASKLGTPRRSRRQLHLGCEPTPTSIRSREQLRNTIYKRLRGSHPPPRPGVQCQGQGLEEGQTLISQRVLRRLFLRR